MIDEDLRGMSRLDLQWEVMRMRRAFRRELNHTGNHRCWINLMEGIDGKAIKPIDIPEDKFIANCRKYHRRNSDPAVACTGVKRG